MEFVPAKRSRNRKKRGHLKKRRREQIRFEVKSEKRRRMVLDRGNTFISKEKSVHSTMQASSFWENYTAAQEWQKRHSTTWWRTRCLALEHENQMLRDKLRSMSYQKLQSCSTNPRSSEEYNVHRDPEEENESICEEETDNLEFHVDEDMMSFLEQSIRHKMELKKKKELESAASKEAEDSEEAGISGGAKWMHTRNKNAKLLYGQASPTILAMETALQTTVDRHKDKGNPQYWPIIPLKL